MAVAEHPYEVSGFSMSYGRDGAAALGIEPERMSKTLLADLAERSSGFVVGGNSTLGQRTRLWTVVDASAELLAAVFVSRGRRGLPVEVAPGDLVGVTAATVGTVAR